MIGTDYDELVPGSFVRVAGGYGYVAPFAYGGAVGRVIGVESTTGRVQIRFPVAVNIDGAHTHGRYVSPTDGTFNRDWLHRVAYVRTRYNGPRMSTNGRDTIGARIVVTGARGDRGQMTVPYDPALTDNGEHAALRYARERLDMCDPRAESWQDRRTGAYVWAITEYGTCECSDEFGPCEWHGETLVTREGAAVRTADDLQHEFCADVCSVTRSYPSPEFERDLIRIGNALADNESHGVRWLPDPDEDNGEDMRDTLSDMVYNGEAHLATHGLSVIWDDGYRIVRVTGGPLA